MFALRIPIAGAFPNFVPVRPIARADRVWAAVAVAGQGEDPAVREVVVAVAAVAVEDAAVEYRDINESSKCFQH